MKLYLVRHGEALPEQLDPQRPLSAQGQLRVQKLAERLAEKNTQVTHIFHSGIVRALQTAEVIAQSLHMQYIEQIAGLRPDDPVDVIVDELNSLNEDILLVGHLPYMANLLWALCGSTSASIQFDTATAVCLERIGDRWTVDSVISPDEHQLL